MTPRYRLIGVTAALVASCGSCWAQDVPCKFVLGYAEPRPGWFTVTGDAKLKVVHGGVVADLYDDRMITPGQHSLSIGCRSVSALPVLDAFNKFKVKGTVEISAVKERTYNFRSRFEGEAAFVWIEDETSGTPVTAVLSAGS